MNTPLNAVESLIFHFILIPFPCLNEKNILLYLFILEIQFSKIDLINIFA